jgi:hypothetical protein
MPRSRLLSLLAAAMLTGIALFSAPVAHANDCVCGIYCWQSGTQWCYQDECCHLYCCDISDPGCFIQC